ncbi:MAG: hypothetical protein BWX84_01556 [Verrucomicrobia bacterium ADurb.Bin118]|nr:MAG: hypothetical protein BWX84_01556 [Verrucomicrobia bacterium ADurb.Bin118]
MFILSPTIVSASSAPFNSIASVSILRRFHGSFQASWLAIKRGVELSNSSTIRSLLARSDEPVSVTSTMASTSSCAFTSVAPQENSTSALTPCFLRYFFVRFTTSVAMRLPWRSFTVLTGECSGTHKTQRAGLRDTLLKINSPTSRTLDPFSTIQSWPVMPQSK